MSRGPLAVFHIRVCLCPHDGLLVLCLVGFFLAEAKISQEVLVHTLNSGLHFHGLIQCLFSSCPCTYQSPALRGERIA